MRHYKVIGLTILGLFGVGRQVRGVDAVDYVASAAPLPKVATGVHLTPLTRNNSPSKTTLKLAAEGRAALPIVISAEASDTTKAVADDLKKYLDQITGANFEITTGDGANGIVLGTLAEFPTPELVEPLKIYHAIDGKEAYAIRTQPNRLLLLGATDKGASHAAYRFLETLGCRWYFPNATGTWEVVPTKANLVYTRDITDRPAFLSRGIWYAWNTFADDGKHPRGTPEHPRSAGSDSSQWTRRNRMGESFTVNAGHNLFNVIGQNQAEFDAHPEFYALTGGKRQGGQIELGNPRVRELVLQFVRKYFQDNPNADMVSIDPADGGGYSESEETKAYAGNASDAQFKMANEAARMLQKEFPGKMVGMYAYNWHSDPPPFDLEPNVYIQLTMGFNAGKLSLDELFEQWPKKAKNLGFYDYFSTWRWDFDLWPGGRISNKNYAPERIRLFQATNARSKAFATSISAESSCNWGVNGRGYYLASKLMWNPQLDENAILQDFYDQAFGPAAAAMAAYYDLQDNPPPMSPGVVGQLFRRLQAAREAAKNRPDVMARLDDLATYLHYYDLNYRPGADAARTLEIQTLMYRNRYSYMNHWEAFRQDSIKEDYNPTAPKPWKVDTPISRDEIEAWMGDGLAYYPELKIPPQTTFSRNVVPVDLGGESKEWIGPTFQAGSPTWTLYSIKGEPIRATIYSYNVYGGEKLSYELRDETGHILAEGKPVGSTGKGTPSELNVPVPKPGRYFLTYNDGSGSMYSITIPAGQPFAFDMSTIASSTISGSTPDLYFYVPKGVKEINYYFSKTDWSNSGPHSVVDPNGKVQATFDVGAEYLSVAVPPGLDGKAWHFTSPAAGGNFGLGRFHFFNCPDLLCPSPAQMLVPQEVAERDDLKILSKP